MSPAPKGGWKATEASPPKTSGASSALTDWHRLAPATLPAAKLRPPLQIGQHLVPAFEVGFEIGTKPIDAGIVEPVQSSQLNEFIKPSRAFRRPGIATGIETGIATGIATGINCVRRPALQGPPPLRAVT